MSKTLLKATETKSQQIINKVLSKSKSVMTKKEVNDRFEYLLCMLTSKQKDCLFRKVSVCDNFINLLDRGVDINKVKSIVKRKHDIKRQNIVSSCEPCQVYVRYKRK